MILPTCGWMPCLEIVFSTFLQCMSFYTASVICDLCARAASGPGHRAAENAKNFRRLMPTSGSGGRIVPAQIGSAQEVQQLYLMGR
jgi:hypothetical protein